MAKIHFATNKKQQIKNKNITSFKLIGNNNLEKKNNYSYIFLDKSIFAEI
tara:strand:+ start:55995 stop:56144 length:150 start_codon:yes stop_codon:yes gene_type:complete